MSLLVKFAVWLVAATVVTVALCRALHDRTTAEEEQWERWEREYAVWRTQESQRCRS